MGGLVTHDLGIIDAVGAELTGAQRAALEGQAGVRLYDDHHAVVAGSFDDTVYPTLVGADLLHGTDDADQV